MFSGKIIKDIRKTKGLTLSDVSAMSNVTESQLSQIENDKANPSIATLISISRALNIPIMAFFGKEELADYPIVRANERVIVKEDTGVKYHLCTNKVVDNFECLYAIYEKDGITGPDGNPYTHNGVEVGFILNGKLEVQSGDETYILNQGDSIRIESSIPHIVKNINDGITTAIWINSPPSF